ncbi:MAG: hypothetical protein H2184_04220 [Candidatus Galacturonibacter soehngenii]|nr:hypothetical protein [Candidatus Galacturonibacter soehngenii]
MNLDSKTIEELQEAYEKCGQTVRIERGHVYKVENEKRTYEAATSISPIAKNFQGDYITN